ncbi:MAG: prolipoprotein diacylglyceryl transferase [Acidobacteria bacterium]|nr:prolipoprotein diacylglyceryl transferase [Acidobacteriota bacterium]
MIPELFSIGPITISPYGILVAVGMFTALVVAAWLGARREGFDRRTVWDFGITLILVALLGAKIFLIFSDPYFSNDLSNIFTVDFLRSAGVFYGGFLVALAWSIWYFRRYGISGWKMADAFAPAIPLGHMFGRLGCFCAGCCHGRATDSFLGVVFTDPQCMVEDHLLRVAIYPTQLIEAAANLLIFGVLFLGYRRKSFDGQMILCYAMMYAVARFIIEFFRGDTRGWVWDQTLSTSQGIAAVIFPIALVLFFIQRKRSATQSR